ncbi:MAG: prepilin-type N-terminal cleavage/methylation domain-containing protein [Planctomycetota bacterium]|jgi:Tfp pilus assembly protein PilV
MKFRRNRRERTTAGFSLLEVVIAMGILSFGLLTLAMMQLYALTQGSAGRHTGDASAVARSYLEQVHRLPWTVLDTAANNGWRNPDWTVPATVTTNVTDPSGGANVEETYTVEWFVADVGGNVCLRDVQVRVSWAEQNMSTPKQLVLATRRYDWGGASC